MPNPLQPKPGPQLLAAHAKDLGCGFMVRRMLPAGPRQAVGPFVFFDHFGPVSVTPADNHGLQLWLALPQAEQEVKASFAHTPAHAIPEVRDGDAQVRVLVGQALGAQSPVVTVSPTLYLDALLPAGGQWTLPMLADEQAVYGVQGDLHIDAQALAPHTMAVLSDAAVLTAGPEGARLVVIGGQPLGRRFIWWNFVSTSKERIEQAGRDWTAGDARVGMGQVPGETERIPLPESKGNA